MRKDVNQCVDQLDGWKIPCHLKFLEVHCWKIGVIIRFFQVLSLHNFLQSCEKPQTDWILKSEANLSRYFCKNLEKPRCFGEVRLILVCCIITGNSKEMCFSSVYPSYCHHCKAMISHLPCDYMLFFHSSICFISLHRYLNQSVSVFTCVRWLEFRRLQTTRRRDWGKRVSKRKAPLAGGFKSFFFSALGKWSNLRSRRGNDPIWRLHMFQIGFVQPPTDCEVGFVHSSSHNHSSVESMGLSNILLSFHLVGNSPLNHGRKVRARWQFHFHDPIWRAYLSD